MSINQKAKKGTVSVRLDAGFIKACFPRPYFPNQPQIKLATGIDTSNLGWQAIALRLEEDLCIWLRNGSLTLPDGSFNKAFYHEILVKSGLRPNLKLVSEKKENLPPKKPDLSVLEVWDLYCTYIEPRLAKTTYKNTIKGQYEIPLKKAIAAMGEDSLEIRGWLLTGRSLVIAKNLLSHLSKAYKLAIKEGKCTHNPFDGMAEEVNVNKKVKTISQDDVQSDNDILDKTRAFTWNEAQIILEAYRTSKQSSHYYNYLKFKFLTGCRPGEASGFWFCDIKWEKERIVIRRSYSDRLKIFKPTKNETERLFPMPRDGELWQLLKSIPQSGDNDVVFFDKKRNPISGDSFLKNWRGKHEQMGNLSKLISVGLISKYLPPYNTRHTFVNHQINDVGVAPHVVNTWCEHSDDVSIKHYRQLDPRITPGYGIEFPTDSKVELLERQIEEMKKMIEKLTEK